MKLWNRPTVLFVLLLSTTFQLKAQKGELEVKRCTAVNRNLAVPNICTDGNNVKWVASGTQVAQVRNCDMGQRVDMDPAQQSVISFFGGNVDFRWSVDQVRADIKPNVAISAAWYDAATGNLWLGTKTEGVYVFKTTPQWALLEHLTAENSKLKSNEIKVIFQDNAAKFWIGCAEGLLTGSLGKWKNELEGYAVQRIREIGSDFYVMADGELWIVAAGKTWRAINIDQGAVEGEPVDFDLDQDGNLWVLSRMAARYNLLTDEFIIFSGPEFYTSEYGVCMDVDQDGAAWIGTEDKGLYVIEKSNAFSVSLLLDKGLGCNGNGKDAALLVKVNNGKAPFVYQWSSPALQGENPLNVPAGNFTVTVTDANGFTKTAKTTVPDNKMTINARQKQPESAPGKSDGAAEVSVEQGQAPFSYLWSNGEKTAAIKNLKAGKYSVTVTDKNACSAVQTIELLQNALPLSVTLEETRKIRCADGDGELTMAVKGGTPPMKIAWNIPGQTAETIATKAGAYSVTLTDAKGNTISAAIVIRAPEALSLSAQAQSAAGTNQANGKAKTVASGGIEPYTFSWDNGETNAQAIKLTAGKHQVTLTDANGCTASTSVDISENIQPLTVGIAETQKITCAGLFAALSVQTGGGKEPFTYRWSNPGIQGTAPANVAAGNYSLTVTDATGATAVASILVKSPETLSLRAQALAAASTGQADGKAKLIASGGVEPYRYAWDTGESAQTAQKLSPGTHAATVTDANGCTASANIDIAENILPLSVDIEAQEKIKCAGERVVLLVTIRGGKAPFAYQWSDPILEGEKPTNVSAGEYRLTVADASGATAVATTVIRSVQPITLNTTVQAPAGVSQSNGKALAQAIGGAGKFTYAWDNGETNATAAKLGPGQHALTVTDANGCTAVASVDIPENILPLALRLEESGAIQCAGQTTTLYAIISGGKPPYQYRWNDPALQDDAPVNVPAGTYSITVSDAAGNSQSAEVIVKSPEPIVVSIVRNLGATTDRSKDGKATLEIKGGTAAYTVVWDNGETGPSAKSLNLGMHRVTVTDAKGCTATTSIETTKRIFPELTAAVLQSGQSIRVEQLQFDADSTNINDKCYPVLNEVYDFLQENGNIVIEVGGHTNNVPSDAFCDRLSTARAKSVADYLIAKGIDPKRVLYKGYGKRKPVANNATAEGRKLNQRVEIKILEIK